MTVTLTPQTIITIGAIVTALVVIWTNLSKIVRWVDDQKKQSADIKAVQEKHDADMAQLRDEITRQLISINNEQTVLTRGVLACLKGQQEQGCNGPVTEAINAIEKYLNEKAHKVES